MAAIPVVVIDDEAAGIKTLQLLLAKHCPQVEVKATFQNPLKALKEIHKYEPRLIFLDIEMPHMNGFEFLQQLKNYTGSVIFVTAHSNYAIRAFKFSALDYLLKPVDTDELKQAVAKFVNNPLPAPQPVQLRTVEKNIGYLSQPVAGKISIPHREGSEIITIKDIEYLQADRNYSKIMRYGEKPFISSRPLKLFEELLINDTRFVRIH